MGSDDGRKKKASTDLDYVDKVSGRSRDKKERTSSG